MLYPLQIPQAQAKPRSINGVAEVNPKRRLVSATLDWKDLDGLDV